MVFVVGTGVYMMNQQGDSESLMCCYRSGYMTIVEV